MAHGMWSEKMLKRRKLLFQKHARLLRRRFFLPMRIGSVSRRAFCEAQYRYRGPRVQGHVEKNRFISAVPFTEIPAPGQSIVFYHSGELVGGGIITV